MASRSILYMRVSQNETYISKRSVRLGRMSVLQSFWFRMILGLLLKTLLISAAMISKLAVVQATK